MADDEDYKGRSGAASYGARKTYRSSPKITNKKQYKDKPTSFVKDIAELAEKKFAQAGTGRLATEEGKIGLSLAEDLRALGDKASFTDA